MKRRHLVVVISAITLLTIIFVAAVTIGVGVGTDPGREQIRSLVQQQVGGRVKGKVHIGQVRGGFLTGFTIDSFAIRDVQDTLLVSTGRVTVQYDLRDLLDRRILLRNVDVERPLFRLKQYEKGDWNFQRIFRRDGPSTPNVPGRSFGDYVVFDSVRVRDGQFIVTRPWSPDDSLTGAKRDSAIRRNLTNPAREIRRSAEGFTQTHRWSRVSGFLPRVRLADRCAHVLAARPPLPVRPHEIHVVHDLPRVRREDRPVDLVEPGEEGVARGERSGQEQRGRCTGRGDGEGVADLPA